MGLSGGGLWGGGGIGTGSGSVDPIAVLSLLDEALRYCGVTMGPGRTPSIDQRADAFLALKRMLNAWEVKRLRILTTIRSTFTLVVSQDSYAIGSGEEWDAHRPTRIERAGVIQSGSETPIAIFTDWEWSEISLKTLTSTPMGIRYEPTVPFGTVRVYPVPSAADEIALYVWSTMAAIASSAESVDLAPAYADGIVFNLAVRLWQKFDEYHHGAPVPQFLQSAARDTLASIESLNSPRPPRIVSDSVGVGRGSWDIRTGGFR